MSTRDEANKIINKHVMWSMGGGLVPVPWIDVAAVTAIELDMLKALANLYEEDYSESKGKAFAASLTGSTVARVGASAMKRLPGIGTVIGGVSMSVLSGASTYAIGKVAVGKMELGDELAQDAEDSAQSSYRDWLERGKQYVTDLVGNRKAEPDIFHSLEKLGDLHKQGVITPEEFQIKKDELLARI